MGGILRELAVRKWNETGAPPRIGVDEGEMIEQFSRLQTYKVNEFEEKDLRNDPNFILLSDYLVQGNYGVNGRHTEKMINKVQNNPNSETITTFSVMDFLKENEILTGLVEPTNENYALAKIFGARLTTSIAIENNLNWRVFIASNLYGPYDHFGTNKSHLLSAVIKKSIEAKEKKDTKIEMWGDGSPKREFTYVTDFSDWIFNSSSILNKLPHILNIGIGEDYSVIDYYNKVLNAIGYSCEIVSDESKANGNMRKLMDSSLARKFGWSPKVGIDEGIKKTIDWYLLNKVEI